MSAKLIAYGCVLTVFCSGAGGMTLPEFRQIVSESQQPCSTGRFVYVETFTQPNRQIADSNTPLGRIAEINRHTRARVEATVDWRGKRVKTKERDLRDIGSIMAEQRLQARDRANLDQSQEVLTSGTQQMFFHDGERLSTGPGLTLLQAPGPVIDKLDLARLGCLSSSAVAGEWDTTFSTTQVDGQPRLIVKRVGSQGGVSTSRILECDPALGYRYRSIRVYSNGALRKEEVADDFRDVGGTPYPHKYRARSFDEKGTVRREIDLTFEKVELNQPVSDEDFTISVPAGTHVMDHIVSGRDWFLEDAENVSIQSMLSRYASQIAMTKMRNLVLDEEAMQRGVEGWEIVIPWTEGERKITRPFVLDLDRAILVSPAGGAGLDWEQIDRALVTQGKGDLAWTGELVLLRGTSLARAVEGQYENLVVKERGSYKIVQIPEGSQFPVGLVVRNRPGREYSVQITEVTSRGIRVVCKRLGGATK